MKYISFIFLFLFISNLNAQSIFGKWKTINGEGVAKSIVKIYEENGEIKGDVVRILKSSARDKLCVKCKDERKNEKIEGMTIIKDMEKEGNRFKGGTILDPENGKVYEAKIWLNEDNPDILNVRGYIGFLYRTQNWIRVE